MSKTVCRNRTSKNVRSENRSEIGYPRFGTIRNLVHHKSMETTTSSMQTTVYRIKSNYKMCTSVRLSLRYPKFHYSVLYIQDALEGPDINRRVFFDPKTLSDDGTIALTGTQSFSKDGQMFAYGVSASGSDWRTVHFRNVSSNQVLADVLIKVKFTNIVWKGNEGIFYGVSSLTSVKNCPLPDIIFCSTTQTLMASQKDPTLEPTKIKKLVFTN